MSPNFAYDDFRLANDFTQFDFRAKSKKLVYLSMGSEPQTMNKLWGVGYDKVKAFLADRKQLGDFTIIREDYLQDNHWRTYHPAITSALQHLRDFIEANPYELGAEREITLKVKVLDKADEIYITGNQPALGQWDPGKVKLKKVSDLERELCVKVRFPMVFKLTKGSWQAEAFTNQSTSGRENLTITDSGQQNINLQILGWN